MLPFFYGGVHPADRKNATCHGATVPMQPAPERVYLPVTAGQTLLVAVGDPVDLGQPLAAAERGTAAVHACVSGKVAATEVRPMADGSSALCLVLENDGRDCEALAQPAPLPLRDVPELLSSEEIIAAVRRAGVAGMGGDAVPTDEKLSAALRRVNVLILNGMECEPYQSADHRLMLERPAAVVGGARLLLRALGIPCATIAVGGNQYDAVSALRALLPLRGGNVTVRALRARYPFGEEGLLARKLTGRRVPAGGSLLAAGCAVFNVATAAAVYDAVYGGRALTHRIVTVTGAAIAHPCNLLVPIGTTVEDLIAAAGGYALPPNRVLVGGPMAGIAQTALTAPILKTTAAVVAMTAAEVKPLRQKEGACLRCGRCREACPQGLTPMLLRLSVDTKQWSALGPLRLDACTECGVCAFVCPARRHLVEHIHLGKVHLQEEGAQP